MARPVTYTTAKKAGDSLARDGEIQTPHGVIRTPAFVSVATRATVRGVDLSYAQQLGMQCIIGNGYHLFLSPGEDIIKRAGGLASFMGWNGPTMTDSGGFQVFSLGVGMEKGASKLFSHEEKAPEDGVALFNEELATEHGKFAVVDDDGVTFTSHIDGSLHRFTPERSIEIQHNLGADIIFAFDEFIEPTAPHDEQRISMNRTHAWAHRSLAAHRRDFEKNQTQGIYGIVQGGRFNDLRLQSARELGSMDFDGYGIGGTLTKKDLVGMLDIVNAELPAEKPRHLLGIGEPEDMFLGVAGGIDTFDCVLPTRNGRNGTVFTHTGKIHITRTEYKDVYAPIDPECDCIVCAKHTCAYIHHLFRVNEMLGLSLASMHNIRFLTRLVEQMREAVLTDALFSFRDAFMERYTSRERTH
jgi:queuine tRNA-ribosyltransferase